MSPPRQGRHVLEDTGTSPSTEGEIERLGVNRRREAYQCNLAGELADP